MSTFIKHAVVRNSTFARALALFTAAGAVGAILASAAPASAARAVVPASGCSTETEYLGDYKVVGSIGIGNLSSGIGSRARNVYCPLPDTRMNPRNDIPAGGGLPLTPGVSQLWVAGYDANNEPGVSGTTDGRVLAQVCMHDDWAGGSICSNWVEVTSNTQSGIQYDTNLGAYTGAYDPLPLFKNPSLAAWYSSLVIALPRTGVYGSSWLYGFTTI